MFLNIIVNNVHTNMFDLINAKKYVYMHSVHSYFYESYRIKPYGKCCLVLEMDWVVCCNITDLLREGRVFRLVTSEVWAVNKFLFSDFNIPCFTCITVDYWYRYFTSLHEAIFRQLSVLLSLFMVFHSILAALLKRALLKQINPKYHPRTIFSFTLFRSYYFMTYRSTSGEQIYIKVESIFQQKS